MKEINALLPKNDVHKRFVDFINDFLSENTEKSKTYIAEQLQVGKSNISEILKYRMGVSVELCSLLIEKFNVNPMWLMTGKGETYLETVQILKSTNTKQAGEDWEKRYYKKVDELDFYKSKVIELQDDLLALQGNEAAPSGTSVINPNVKTGSR